MKVVNVLGIDLAKSVFQLHGIGQDGKCVLRKQIRRSEFAKFIAQLPTCLIVMEACSGSSFWGRKFRNMGHEVKLIAPQFVKPFVKSMKNDSNDAEAIAIAAVQSGMRFVPIKEVWQQDLQAIHRSRDVTMKSRIATSNAILGLMHEHGVIIAKGCKTEKLLAKINEVLAAEESGLSDLIRETLKGLSAQAKLLNEQIEVFDQMILRMARSREDCKRIMKIEGVGAMTATAILGSTSVEVFKSGRHFAASLGLVPRQHSSGGRTVLMGISKRGDKYLRKLLIHGARSALRTAGGKETARSVWVLKKAETRGQNKAIVALANKNARVIWALLTKKEEYRAA